MSGGVEVTACPSCHGAPNPWTWAHVCRNFTAQEIEEHDAAVEAILDALGEEIDGCGRGSS